MERGKSERGLGLSSTGLALLGWRHIFLPVAKI
jgi:hypothetical protein